MTNDEVLPFQMEAASARGRIVRLNDCVTTIMRQHDYPVAVCRLLAEAAAMAAALGTALKFDGVFTLQTKTDGAVSMLVVDVTSAGAVRACAQFDREAIAAGRELLGAGQLVFTVDQKASDERYQGIVQLSGEGLASAFQTYFKQSEQIPTGMMAAASPTPDGGWIASCLMVQRMPKEGGQPLVPPSDTGVEDDWSRVMMLMNTCTNAELTDPALPAQDVLYRLFHEEGVRVYDPVPLRHECRCSQEKIRGVLSGLPPDELKGLAQDNGLIGVTCQFCSHHYEFSPEGLC